MKRKRKLKASEGEHKDTRCTQEKKRKRTHTNFVGEVRVLKSLKDIRVPHIVRLASIVPSQAIVIFRLVVVEVADELVLNRCAFCHGFCRIGFIVETKH